MKFESSAKRSSLKKEIKICLSRLQPRMPFRKTPGFRVWQANKKVEKKILKKIMYN